ncbi:Bax inhibitor-1/YccA family protein [Canibacter sp. lx-45]|uniref:Bax inhibitor-1/YccA family protein n=1 Tax=Canibacter zhuwentaonis TaxID=2837491 RepID=UPI001BDDB47F|nr:Bax inhibitor-1/YccA family protein [Canibacter zhuwentaonis]MBT1035635.1 Bax inhibitor-1/YccA family protein [Canibacter zhuwentaonis]
MSNPALKSMPAFSNRTLTAKELEELYNQPSAQKPVQQEPAAPQTVADVVGGSATPMTFENTIRKTAVLFGVLLLAAAVGWFVPALALPAALIGFALCCVITLKKKISVPLIVLYSVVEGLFVGGISSFFERQWDGIVPQAVLGTLVVFATVLALFCSGKVRATPRMTKIVTVAIIGYALFSLVNVVLMITGAVTDPWGLRGATIMGIPLGVLIGGVAIFLASYSLVMDFEQIKNGVASRLPEKYGWLAGFGLVVTLIWLYVEILRVIAILRGND